MNVHVNKLLLNVGDMLGEELIPAESATLAEIQDFIG
jgi:hypothetical protein